MMGAPPLDGREGRPVAGLDGGGTRTACLVCMPDGSKLCEGRGGPLNTNYVSPAEAQGSVEQALAQAAAGAGISLRDLGCIAAAAPWSEDVVQAVAARLAPQARVLIPGEDVAALLGGSLEPHGLVLIAGTGSRCAYVPGAGGESAEAVVSGAWGSLFGDEGSGYDIGRRALQAVTRSWDGRAPATGLAGLIAAEWGISDHKDLVRRVYGQASEPSCTGGTAAAAGAAGAAGTAGGWRERIASVCPIVGRAASTGDPVACGILDKAADEHALLIRSVVTRAGLQRPARVVLSGGVFALGGLIVDRLRSRLEPEGYACIVLPLFPPVGGALLAAARASGLDAGEGSEIVRALAARYRQGGTKSYMV